MTKLIPFALLTALIFMFACSNESAAPTTKTELSVTGMVCEMGCGTSLKKGLIAAGIDTPIEVKFDEESGLGKVVVEHNATAFPVEKLIATIEALNDGQFKAELVNSVELSAVKIKESDSEKGNDHYLTEAKHRSFYFPDLTALIKNLLPF